MESLTPWVGGSIEHMADPCYIRPPECLAARRCKTCQRLQKWQRREKCESRDKRRQVSSSHASALPSAFPTLGPFSLTARLMWDIRRFVCLQRWRPPVPEQASYALCRVCSKVRLAGRTAKPCLLEGFLSAAVVVGTPSRKHQCIIAKNTAGTELMAFCYVLRNESRCFVGTRSPGPPLGKAFHADDEHTCCRCMLKNIHRNRNRARRDFMFLSWRNGVYSCCRRTRLSECTVKGVMCFSQPRPAFILESLTPVLG